MKNWGILLFLGCCALTACNRETKTTETTKTSAVATETQKNNTPADAEYRKQANRTASQMATDMKFDQATQSKVENLYYDRNRRMGEIHNRYNWTGTNQSGGLATGTDTTGMHGEISAVNRETDNALRDILSPIQYESYQARRSTYVPPFVTPEISRNIQVDGEEITVKTEDMKVKAGPGESKVETSTYESKKEGQKTKYKTKDTKLKVKDNQIKVEKD